MFNYKVLFQGFSVSRTGGSLCSGLQFPWLRREIADMTLQGRQVGKATDEAGPNGTIQVAPVR